MKTSRQYKWHTWLLMLAAVIMLSMTGCGENDTDGDDDDDAPTIPPAYTLAPDFSSMGGERAGTATLDQAAPADALKLPDTQTGSVIIQGSSCSRANYNHAAGHVLFWNTALWVTLAVPSRSFVAAVNHDPVQQDDGSWIWSYDVNIANVNYTAELHGAFVDGEVQWHMYITKQGEYEDFLWYQGTSNLPATAGTWTLKNNPTDQEDWIGIEWSRNIANQTWRVTYTNIRAGDANEGGFIEYGIDADTDYDAFYDIYNIVDDNLVEIDSNTSSEAGRVRNQDHFGDNEWRLWDGDHCDMQP
jgi:hypothetical protein